MLFAVLVWLLQYLSWVLLLSIQATFKGWMDIMYAAVDSPSKVIK